MIKVNPTYRPARAFAGRYRVIYGGAGSGKSVFVAQDEMDRAWNDPRQRVLILRKVAKTIRNSCFQLVLDVLRATGRLPLTRVHKQEMRLTFPGGGEMICAGLDDPEKLKSITGITRIWIEEATELDIEVESETRNDLAQVDLRLRGVMPELCPQVTITFNPTQQARRIFEYLQFPVADLPSRGHTVSGDVFVQHTTHLDNPYVGEEYISVFQRLGGVMQAVYERGELTSIDAPDQVIPYEYVKRAFDLDPAEAWTDGKKRMGIDVARFGNDKTSFAIGEGFILQEIELYSNLDIARSTDIARLRIQEYSIDPALVAVDTVGLGAGLADGLRAAGYHVSEIVAGAKPVLISGWSDSAPDFNNLRSQMWFYARDMMREGRVAIAISDGETRRKLQEDLLAPRYRFGQDRRIEVEPKDGKSKNWGIRQRLGRSTDYADPFLQMLIAEHVQHDQLFIISIEE